jgi:hypothetical protein
MPNKQTFKRESIEHAAFQLVRTKGMSELNARSLAFALRCSTQPLFTYFKNMGEIKDRVIQMSYDFFVEKVSKSYKDPNPVLSYCQYYLAFCQDEPYLYELLFMTKANNDLVKRAINEQGKHLVDLLCKKTSLGLSEANVVYLQTWIYAQGLSTLFSTGLLSVNKDSASRMLEAQYRSALMMFDKQKGSKKPK